MRTTVTIALTGLCLLGGGLLSCGKSEPAAPASGADDWANSPRVCPVDQVREYFCDGLLPLTAALPAPEPFSNCPSNIEHHEGNYEPLPPVAVFDSSYTAYMRKRHPPGHNCCYSWCSAVPIKSLAEVLPQAGCTQALAIRETFCMPVLEGGTSSPASEQLPNCPAAIQPPAAKAFSVPPAAPLDLVSTNQRRSVGFDECCYGWCSVQPGGSY